MQKADQDLFAKKVIKFVLPKYKKAYGVGFVETQHVEDLTQLGNLDYYGARVGGYKCTRAINMGSLLNAFNKTFIRVELDLFLAQCDDSETWQFIFSIPSSTALYVIIPKDSHEYDEFDEGRFTASVMATDQMVTIMRLDDLLRIRWGGLDDD